MTEANSRPPKKKWSVWGAAFCGLILQAGVFVLSNLADGGKDLGIWLQARPGEMIGYFGGQLLFAPLLFVVITLIHNRFAKT